MIASCTINCWTLEILVKNDPVFGVPLTLCQFIGVTAMLFPFIFGHGFNPRKYLLTAMIFWGSSVLNNYTFSYKLSVGTQSILRSGNLLLVELTSIWLGRKKYGHRHFVACLIISLGLCILGWSLFNPDDLTQFKGLGVVAFAVGVGVILTQVQDCKNYVESTFWTHALALPLFWLIGTPVPSPSVYLGLNMLTQIGCILGVNMLFSKYTRSQTVILLTLRKMITVIISTWVNPTLPLSHVIISTICVFGGSLLYSL